MEVDMNKFCQSCGMPMKKDPQQGGTNSDGSKNDMYCSLCYKNGGFVDKFTTAQEMQAFCIVKMNECGVPKWVAWLFTRGIPKLKRWNP